MKRKKLRRGIARIALGAMLSAQLAAPITWAQAGQSGSDSTTTTPIKHVIVLIGENRSFDHTFGTYRPKGHQTVSNLLSKGIVLADGSPGPNAAEAIQYQVTTLPSTYFISVGATNKTPYATLPTPQLNGAPNVASSLTDLESNPTGVQPPFDDSITFGSVSV